MNIESCWCINTCIASTYRRSPFPHPPFAPPFDDLFPNVHRPMLCFVFLSWFVPPKHGQEIVVVSCLAMFASFPIALGEPVVRNLVHTMQRLCTLSRGSSDFCGITSNIVSQHGASNGLCTTHTQLLYKNSIDFLIKNSCAKSSA